MSWQFWIGWSGSAVQLVICAVYVWLLRRRESRLKATLREMDAEGAAKLHQFGIDAANEQAAFLIAMGWHWGTMVERRNWVQRMMGVDDV